MILEPVVANLQPDEEATFTTRTFNVDLETGLLAGELLNFSGLSFNLSQNLLPIPNNPFQVGQVISSTANSVTIRINSNAIEGMSDILVAGVENDNATSPAASIITVIEGSAGTPNCVENTNNVTSLQVTPSEINLSLLSGQLDQMLSVQAFDSNGVPVTTDLSFFSDNTSIATVDATGLVEAAFSAGTGGTTTITVCVGNVSEQITVNVGF